MKHKVVINKFYGGFSLSEKAVKLLREIKNDQNIDSYTFTHTDEGFFRHDKDLVTIVESLGEDSFGAYARLEVVEVEGNQYLIDDYDGLESIVTPSTIDWTEIDENVVIGNIYEDKHLLEEE